MLSPAETVELECLRSVERGEEIPDGCDAAAYSEAGLIDVVSGLVTITHQGRQRLADLRAKSG